MIFDALASLPKEEGGEGAHKNVKTRQQQQQSANKQSNTLDIYVCNASVCVCVQAEGDALRPATLGADSMQ